VLKKSLNWKNLVYFAYDEVWNSALQALSDYKKIVGKDAQRNLMEATIADRAVYNTAYLAQS
jgi:hypothetical protein